MTDCKHRYPETSHWGSVEVGLMGEVETQLVGSGGQSAQEDLDIGRFRCALCGQVGYYTGQWRGFFEDDVPCLGSDRIVRDPGMGKKLADLGAVVAKGSISRDTLRRILDRMLE